MKRIAFAHEAAPPAAGHRPQQSGTFQRKLLEGHALSEDYRVALEFVTEKVSCTDLRELLRLIPAVFESAVKVEIELNREPEPLRFGAVVDAERIYFTVQSNLDDALEKARVPLVIADGGEMRRIGDMHVLSFRPLSLNTANPNDGPETARVLDLLGSLVARTIDARLDGLTMLPQRKYFDRSLEEHAARFASERKNFSLILIDIDHFKRINDGFGHKKGDEVLAAVARILHNGVRARSECMDMVFRHGGEEFAVVLPEVSRSEAAGIAERLRAAIKAHDFGIGRAVTCSFGVADASESATPQAAAQEVSRLADERLYLAKRGGRDSVVGLQAVKPSG
jgi:diguanylate cyclase (GGDEF)-like protein